MINSIVQWLFRIVFDVLKFIANLLLTPITLLIKGLFPDFSNLMGYVNMFKSDYILPAIGMGREIFLNLTGFPFVLIQLSVTLALAMFGFIGFMKSVALIVNLWRKFKGGG